MQDWLPRNLISLHVNAVAQDNPSADLQPSSGLRPDLANTRSYENYSFFLSACGRQSMTGASEQLLKSPPREEILFEQVVQGIEARGYVCLPTALPEEISDCLLELITSLDQSNFRQARIGRGKRQNRNRFVRRDRICWIEESDHSVAIWFDWIGRLQSYINKRLFLGLFSFESHLSLYQQGDFYRKHLDAFKGESNRILSFVAHLNRGWESDQGGELVIYSPDDGSELIRVTPGFGTLVLFLSEEFPHEVLSTERDRYAVAGWFRLNNTLNDNLDPPC